jgi:hypothetical protein
MPAEAATIDEEVQVPFTYEREDVVAAQRLRLLYSRRLRLLLLIGIVAIAVLIIQLSALRSGLSGLPGGWSTPVVLGAVFALLVALAYLLAPIIEYQMTSAWRSRVVLQINTNGLRMSGTSSPAGFELAWPQVSGLLENERVWLLFFGGEQDFLIVPKRIFQTDRQTSFFRSMLLTHDFTPE